MAKSKKLPATTEELLISSFAAADALAKLLIDKGVITEAEYTDRLAQERSMYKELLDTKSPRGPVGNA